MPLSEPPPPRDGPAPHSATPQDGGELGQVLAVFERIAVFGLTPQGRIATWNPAAERILGFTSGEILGEPYARLHTPDAVADGLPGRALRDAGRLGRYAAIHDCLRSDGKRFRAGVMLTAAAAGDGAAGGYVAVHRDLTERSDLAGMPRGPEALRRENETRLRESE